MSNFRQHLGVALIGILSLTASAAAQEGGASAASSQPVSTASLPDSPGTVQSKARQIEIAQATTPQLQQRQKPADSATAPSTQKQPVGTAAAPPVNTTGNAASEPAGIAIAPAKQRRTRTMLIKVGAILGAGAAIATTMALAKGSPSKPPGAP